MTIKLANNVSGFLNTAITASDTGIVLQSGNGASFPALGAGEYFYATLVSTGGTLEVVKVTARSGDSMTVVRAQDGTSAASFAAGSRLEMRINAAAVREAIGDVTAAQVGFTPTGDIIATDVQAALAEVDTKKIAFTRLDDSDGSSLMGFLQAGTGAQARTVQSKLRDVVSVLDFGADPTGNADSTSAVQHAMDFFATTNLEGGTVYFPHGKYLIQGTLVPKSENIRFVGDGNRFPNAVETDTDVPATLYKTGTGPLIRLDTQYRCNGFSTYGITLFGDPTDKPNIVAVEWYLNGPFRRNFYFDKTTIMRFNDAFLLTYVPGAPDAQVGVVHIDSCAIMKNNYIWRHASSNTQVNGFTFQRCDAGQNGYSTGGGIYGLRAHEVTITDNILEGQRDPIYLVGNFRSARIQNNYFEANVGEACIKLEGTTHGIVGPNIFLTPTTDYKVRMLSCLGITVLDPAWQYASILCNNGQYNVARPNSGEANITSPAGVENRWMTLDRAKDAKLTFRDNIAYGAQLGTDSRSQWIDGTVILVGENSLTSGQLLIDTFALTANTGDFLVATYALKYTDAPSDMYVSLRVNSSGSAALGTWSSPFQNISYCPTNEWMIVTVACRALDLVTSFQVYLWPFGLTHSGTKNVQVAFGTAFACTDPSEIKPFIDVNRCTQTPAIPVAGTWERGDKLWTTTATAGSPPGWVCTTAGTPGTWKAMADLAP